LGLDGRPIVEWQTSLSNAYTLQFKERLEDPIWRIPAHFPLPSTNASWLDPEKAESRFYRLLSVPSANRGNVLAVVEANTLSKDVIGALLELAQVPIVPVYGVREYQVYYETISPEGAPTVASGALLLPENTGSPLPLICYQHGTIVVTNTAPSSLNLLGEAGIGVAVASTGYAAAVPDYLGLGQSPGFHPYQHARSEATACVDMLRAVKTLCATNGFPLNSKLFLCGYSQGGHATLALLREIEYFHTNEFTVTACAPMAGAYDLSGVSADDFLSARPKPNPYYFLYLLAAYQRVYHLGESLGALLVSPYDQTLPPLLGGNTSESVINTNMPANPIDILKPEVLASFKIDPRNPLRLALRDNDIYRWVPAAPLRFFHCSADADVIVTNTLVAVSYMQAAGRPDVQWYDPSPTSGHTDCALPAMLMAKEWFDSLR
jgi:dienelactone hydrolase